MAMKKALTRKLGMEYYSYDRGSESEYEDEELPPKEELEYLELIQKTKESIRQKLQVKVLNMRTIFFDQEVESFILRKTPAERRPVMKTERNKTTLIKLESEETGGSVEKVKTKWLGKLRSTR
uniref:Uncharacterized protein n=1 Tax=Brassica oleracea var. oleracea TaxID=109376 RepID=A0A0D3A5J1_BRAOL